MALSSTTGHKHIPASARAAAVTTAGLWSIAVLLFTGQAQRDIALGDGAMQVIVYGLLALGSTGFWMAFMRVGEELVDADARIAYELDPDSILKPTRDRTLDRLLARGLAVDRPPDFWPTGTWRVFARIGVTFWVIYVAASAGLLAHWWRIDSPQRGVLLVILMIPAVQCTAAAVIGPGITRMLGLREAAREARRRLCEQTAASPHTSAAARPSAAEEDLRETVIIHLEELRDTRTGAKDRPLRIVRAREETRRRFSG